MLGSGVCVGCAVVSSTRVNVWMEPTSVVCSEYIHDLERNRSDRG